MSLFQILSSRLPRPSGKPEEMQQAEELRKYRVVLRCRTERAQGLAPLAAARAAVVLHARAADRAAAEAGERGLLPSDCLPTLRRLVNPA